LVVLAVVIAVLICMIFMPGMAIFVLAAGAAAVLFRPRLIRLAGALSSARGYVGFAKPLRAVPAGPGPPLLSPLRL
jgi:hypothetical protein